MSKEARKPFTVGLCGVCEKYAVCAAPAPDVLWCKECLPSSLGWVQMTEEQRALFLVKYAEVEAMPPIKKLLDKLATVDEPMRHAIAIGESRRRLQEER